MFCQVGKWKEVGVDVSQCDEHELVVRPHEWGDLIEALVG